VTILNDKKATAPMMVECDCLPDSCHHKMMNEEVM
jgi:hypothetical protein